MSDIRVQQARSALQADPTQAQLWVDYLQALIDAGQPDEARKMLSLGRNKGLQGDAITRLAQQLEYQQQWSPSSVTTKEAAVPTHEEATAMAALLTSGRHAQAESPARAMTSRYPQSSFAWSALGAALSGQERHAEALGPAQMAVQLAPHEAGEHYNLGKLYLTLERAADAEPCFVKAVKLKPDLVNAQYMLGASLQALGRLQEAQSAFRTATRLHPAFCEAHYNLGTISQAQGQLHAAELSYRKAIALRPEFVEAHQNLGVTLHMLGRLEEAIHCFEAALVLDERNARTHANLGASLQGLDRHEQAEHSLRRAVELAPGDAVGYNNLGISLGGLGRYLEAQSVFRQALALQPALVDSHYNISTPLQNFGQLDEAALALQTALRLAPSHMDAQGNLLFVLNYHPDKPAEDIYAAYRAYDAQFGLPLRVQWAPHANTPLVGTLTAPIAPRRLRIGYVSPDLRQHSVRHFLEPLLASHDRSRFEVFAYAELAVEDVATARYRTYCDHFILTRGMSDEALAARIRADAIDILVDLAGHTAGNRLLTFARKPAPVSLSWMGYGYTTGLKAIDYLLTDEASAPVGSEHLFSEAPWRLPGGAYVFRPDSTMGDISPLPALANGCITFGTLSRAIRINHRTVRVWAEILKRVPGSRLVIDSKNFQHASMQDAMAERFAPHGIARERLLIGCHSPPWDTLRSMDIGLDCFPHNSGTTLFESLFMGVPFVTLAGRPSVGRLGKSILTSLGHPQWMDAWCAASEEDYIDKAVALASDLGTLQHIRTELRPQMQRSALMDEAGFARRVEAAYVQMFARWLDSKPQATVHGSVQGVRA